MTLRWRRWMVRIGLAIVALPVLALLLLFLFEPEGTVIMVAVLLHPLIANTKPPAMFADLLTGARVPNQTETNRQMTARLQHEFPIGTTETALQKALEAQGFKAPAPPPQNCVQPVQGGQPLRTNGPVTLCPPPDQRKSLKYEWGNGICGETIWIRWSTDTSSVITLLDGYYNTACL